MLLLPNTTHKHRVASDTIDTHIEDQKSDKRTNLHPIPFHAKRIREVRPRNGHGLLSYREPTCNHKEHHEPLHCRNFLLFSTHWVAQTIPI
jgi:hypothetical protein